MVWQKWLTGDRGREAIPARKKDRSHGKKRTWSIWELDSLNRDVQSCQYDIHWYSTMDQHAVVWMSRWVRFLFYLAYLIPRRFSARCPHLLWLLIYLFSVSQDGGSCQISGPIRSWIQEVDDACQRQDKCETIAPLMRFTTSHLGLESYL